MINSVLHSLLYYTCSVGFILYLVEIKYKKMPRIYFLPVFCAVQEYETLVYLPCMVYNVVLNIIKINK